MWKHSTLG